MNGASCCVLPIGLLGYGFAEKAARSRRSCAVSRCRTVHVEFHHIQRVAAAPCGESKAARPASTQNRSFKLPDIGAVSGNQSPSGVGDDEAIPSECVPSRICSVRTADRRRCLNAEDCQRLRWRCRFNGALTEES